MKILLLGPTGQLGQALLPELQARSLSCTSLSRKNLDLADLESIEPALNAHDFDVLINAVAHHGTEAIEQDPGTAFLVNGRAVGALAEGCAEKNARLVHVSTDYVFDGTSERPYVETDAPAPINAYGASKLMGESLARRAHPEGALVVRTASLYGTAASGHGSGSFVETVLKAAREARELRVVDNVVMSPTSAHDLSRAILDLLEADAPAGMYHAVNGGDASWFAFARAVLELAGQDPDGVEAVDSSSYATAAARPRYSVLDTGKAARFTSFRDWRSALAEHLERRADPERSSIDR